MRVIDKKEALGRPRQQVRLVVIGTQALELRQADGDACCAWIKQVLPRFGYRQLAGPDRALRFRRTCSA